MVTCLWRQAKVEGKAVLEFVEASPRWLWDLQRRGADKPGYSKARMRFLIQSFVWQAASAVTPMVTSNSSRSHEIWSLRALHANLEASED